MSTPVERIIAQCPEGVPATITFKRYFQTRVYVINAKSTAVVNSDVIDRLLESESGIDFLVDAMMHEWDPRYGTTNFGDLYHKAWDYACKFNYEELPFPRELLNQVCRKRIVLDLIRGNDELVARVREEVVQFINATQVELNITIQPVTW